LKYLIVTNNLAVIDKFDNILFTEGTYEDVLIRVRDLVHQGFELISHPVGASIRMIFSPYRSIIIGNKNEKINPYHIETIENSIINYRKLTEGRKIDSVNAEDYAVIDIMLLEDALNLCKSA
jgi:acetate kinase